MPRIHIKEVKFLRRMCCGLWFVLKKNVQEETKPRMENKHESDKGSYQELILDMESGKKGGVASIQGRFQKS